MFVRSFFKRLILFCVDLKEMELVQLDGMLGHVQGERSSEEKEKNRMKVLELEQIYKKKLEVYNIINSQYINAKVCHLN